VRRGQQVFEQVQRQEQAPVAVVQSQATADLLVAACRVHGIEASTYMASAIPSIDWVQGFAVLVADADAEDARRLLRELGHTPFDPEQQQ